MTPRRWAIAAVAAVAAIAGAWAVGHSVISPAPISPPRTTTPAVPRPPSASDGSGAPTGPARASPRFVTFHDGPAGFSIGYPANWVRLQPVEPDAQLLVAHGRGTSLLVRVTPVGLRRVTRGNLAIVRPLTDGLVQADERVRVLGSPRQVTVAGLPGYRYVYALRIPGARRPAVHVHYFLFRKGQVIALVFQILPAERLAQLAPTLAAVLRTFRG